MSNFVSRGDALTITAGVALASGAGVLIGGLFGVAARDIASGEEGIINLTGVYDLPKVASQAWTVGALIYWTGTACTITRSSNKLIGIAVSAVGGSAGETIGRVRLNGAAITTVPVGPVAPYEITAATITPASGSIGTVFTLADGVFAGTAPITVAGILTLDGEDVTAQMSGNTYTSIAAGALVWTVTATNSVGSTDSSASASASVDIAVVAPSVISPASITPASGSIGTVFILAEGVFAGTAPITVAGILTLDGVDVTAQMSGLSYTATDEGALVWTITATNSAGVISSSASATVNEVGDGPVDLPITPAARWHPEFSTVTTSGGRVTAASDIQGLAATVEGDTGAGPTVLTDGLGRKFWRFEGDQALEAATDLILDRRAFAMFMVMRSHRCGIYNPIFNIGAVSSGVAENVLQGVYVAKSAANLRAFQNYPRDSTTPGSEHTVVGSQMQVVGLASRERWFRKSEQPG